LGCRRPVLVSWVLFEGAFLRVHLLALLLDGPYGGKKRLARLFIFFAFGPVAGKHEGALLGFGIGCFGELPGLPMAPVSHRTHLCCIQRGSLRRQVYPGALC